MTHPWREHIKITKEKHPDIKNFGEIIKLAKKTYVKTSNKKTVKNNDSINKGLKKTSKKTNHDKKFSETTEISKEFEENDQTGGVQIFADKIDNKGEKRRYRALKEGPCIFPFKYNNKTLIKSIIKENFQESYFTVTLNGRKDEE